MSGLAAEWNYEPRKEYSELPIFISTSGSQSWSKFFKLPYVVLKASNVSETVLIALLFLYPFSIAAPDKRRVRVYLASQEPLGCFEFPPGLEHPRQSWLGGAQR